MKYIKLCIIIVFMFTLYGCAKHKEFYGECVSVSGDTKAAYSKAYVMMDCCNEWADVVLFANIIPNASYVEAFEYYLYDEHENKISNKAPLTVTVTPSDRFTYDTEICVYFLNDLSPIDVTKSDIGYTFVTNKTGIFLLVKTNPNVRSVYIRNDDDCHGQCRECSAY